MTQYNWNSPNLKKILDLLEINKEDLDKHSSTFVPYLYLDGHRSSCIGENEVGRYKSGFNYFLRFTEILKSLGFKQLVSMVHTHRNFQVGGRIESVKVATQESIVSNIEQLKSSNINFYGDLELYKENGFNDFYKQLKSMSHNSLDSLFNHHVLINYSEKWALENLNKIDQIPEVSSIIRFTKGHVSGGWIPLKMQETTIIYSQIPSVSEFWSDDGIVTLILIAFTNWMKMKDFIGQKSYIENEREKIHKIRDIDLNYTKIELSLNSPNCNRIITFDSVGPIEYEIT